MQGRGCPTFFIQTCSVPFVSPVVIVHTQPHSLAGLSDLLWQGFVFSFVVDFIPFRFKQALNLSHWVCEFWTFFLRTRFRHYTQENLVVLVDFFGLWGFGWWFLMEPMAFLKIDYLQVLLIFSAFPSPPLTKILKKMCEWGSEVAVKCKRKIRITLPWDGKANREL